MDSIRASLKLGTLAISIFAFLATATPIPSTFSSRLYARSPVDQLLTIAPTSATCASSPFPSECTTAADALDPILSSFTKYSITNAGSQAALLSWMAFESADFKYNINHYPGTPGQGTRCMMSPAYVSKYIASIPTLSSRVTGSGSTPAGALALVLDNDHSFATAAWFLSTQCSDDVKSGLEQGTDEAWENFVTDCVQTTVTDERREYWDRAKSALSVR